MAENTRIDDIEVNQDLRFQEREWKVQRVGWVLMLLIALAALLGLFGRGPLADVTERSAGGDVIVEYDRFVRRAAPTRIVLRFERASGLVGVWIDQRFLERNELIQVVPVPLRTTSGGGRVSFYFALQPGGHVAITYEPRRIGTQPGAIGVITGPVFPLHHFVFP